MKILFLTLRTFSATGGIEKVCRVMGKALYESSISHKDSLQVCSMYDAQPDAFNNVYFPSEYFRGYKINKLLFIKNMLLKGRKSDVIILSHINLLLIGWMVKKINPSVRIILLGHGIEIWYPVGKMRRKMLQSCDMIVCVSNFTKKKIMEVHSVPGSRCSVLNNCLDPLLPLPLIKGKNNKFLEKYGFLPSDTIIMTLTRISSKERYKGYEKVIEAVAMLSKKYDGLRYLVAGAYDDVEKRYLDMLIKNLQVQDSIILPGFIKNEELEDHFAFSDMYVMPSRKEGFGIVFIEAMYYGLPVVAGNLDGSADAVLNGRLGQLVNPDSVPDLANAMANIIENKVKYLPQKTLLMDNFSYEVYKRKLEYTLQQLRTIEREHAAA